MPLPWEQIPDVAALSARPPKRARRAAALPWELPEEPAPASEPEAFEPPDIAALRATAAPPPLPEPEPEEGLLSKIGYALDTPGAYFRGLLAGKAGERVSGQELLEATGLADRSEEPAPFFSGKGLAGFGAELLLDPTNLLPGMLGVKAATRAGRAAAKLAPHLDEAAKAVRAFEGVQRAAKAAPTVVNDMFRGQRAVPQIGAEALEAARKGVMEHPVFGRLVDDAGRMLPEEQLLRQAAERSTPIGQAARDVASNKKGLFTRVAEDAGERVRQGHEGTFTIGGEYSPIPLPFIADKLKFELPEAVLFEAPKINRTLQKAGKAVAALPGIKQAANLFKGTPEEKAAGLARTAAEGTQDVRLSKLNRVQELAGQINTMPPGSSERLAAEAELERLAGELAPPSTPGADFSDLPEIQALSQRAAPLAEEASPFAADEAFWDEALQPNVSAASNLPPPPAQVKGAEVAEPKATNPVFIREQYQRARQGLIDPIAQQALETEQRIMADAERKAKALEAGNLEGAVYNPKPGQAVEVWPKDVTSGTAGRRRNAIRGKVIAENTDGTFTVQESTGAQHTVPKGAVQRVAKRVQQDVDALEESLLPPEHKRQVMQRSADTREALRAANPLAPEAYMNRQSMNIEAKKARTRDMQDWGVLDFGRVGQAQALPKAVEKLVNTPQAIEQGLAALPELKSLEFIGADAAELASGDSLRIGGDVFKVLPDAPPGRVRLKDGFAIEVPEHLVPKDRGTPIQRAGGPEILTKDLPPDLAALAQLGAQRVRDEARGLATSMRPEAPPLDVMALLESLDANEAQAMQRAQMASKAAGSPAPKGIPAGVKSVATSRGRVQELVDAGMGLEDARRVAAGEGALQGVRAGPELAGAGGGRMPPIPPAKAPTAAPLPEGQPSLAVSRARTEASAAGLKNAGAAIPKDLAPEAAKQTAELMKALAGFSPEEGREFLSYAERAAKGPIPEKYAKTVEAWHAHHDRIADFERKTAGAAKLSTEGGLGYALHLSEPSAKATFQAVYKDPAKAAKVHELLNQKRTAKGLPPINFQAGAAPTDAARLARMEPELQQALERLGLSTEYLTRTFNPSMIERAYKGLGVSEINDAFRQAGFRPVFSEDPQRLLFARQMRHVQVRAQADYLNELVSGGAGVEIGAAMRGEPVRGMPGIEAVRLPDGRQVFTAPELNASRPGAGVGFDSPDLAEAAAKTFRKMTTPEEVSPVLAWYDGITKLWKSYLTRPFPAYHVRNHIGNRLQGWVFESVPVTGDHYRTAQRILAGRDVKVTLGDGRTLNRAQIIELGLKAGMGRGGFYEDLLDEIGRPAAGQKAKGSWNPLDPNNRMIQAAEKASAAIAAAPGAVLSGAPELVKQASGEALENSDRWGAFTYFLQQGFTPSEAVRKVNRAMFDYSGKSLSDVERTYARRAVFFYNYVANVIPRVIETALTDTRKLAPFAHLSQQPGKPEPLPRWAAEGLAVPLGSDAQGNPMVLTGLDTPVEAALEPFEGFTGGPGRGLAKLGSSLNPLLKIPVELATGKDLFMGKDIADLKKAPHWVEDLPIDLQALMGVVKQTSKTGKVRYEMDPDALYALRNSPLGRFSNTASRATDQNKGVAEMLANLTTGARVVSVDTEREAGFQRRDAIIARLKELEAQGLVSGFTLPEMFGTTTAGEESELLPEIEALLAATRPARKAKAQGGAPQPKTQPRKRRKANAAADMPPDLAALMGF